jgi:prepilin signal peptidase PulO-like enzyme (type II secretory pathway)
VSAGLFLIGILVAHGQLAAGLAFSMALWSMLLITIIDVRTQMIPDALTIVLVATALTYRFTIGDVSILPALIGIGFFGAQWIVSRGRWVGSGDIFLAGALGLLVGTWQIMVLTLMLSYIIGAVIALVLLAKGRTKKSANISFGPFLILGTIIAMMWGPNILEFVLP